MVAIFDKLLEYNCMTPTQHRKFYQKSEFFLENVNKHMFFLLLNN